MTQEEKYNRLKKDYDDFVYIVSHDFRASFRKINSLTGWMKEDLESEDLSDMKDNIKLLQRSAKQMDGMLHGLTMISRVDRIERIETEVNIEKLIQLVINENNLKFKKIETKGQSPIFKTNEEKLKNILTEVLKNAYIFNNSQEKQVIINWSFSDSKITLEIIDNGIGIANKDHEMPFKLFYNEHFKTKIDTTGYGLTYARKLVESEEGTISINNSSELGTTIKIKL